MKMTPFIFRKLVFPLLGFLFSGGAVFGESSIRATQEAEVRDSGQEPSLTSSLSEAGVGELQVAPSLKALWEKGGETDFSQEGWRSRVGVSVDRWDHVAGGKVSDLTGSEAFYGAASYSDKKNSFEYVPEQAVANEANGVRMRAVLVIPADGAYSFALAADDGADLYVGEVGGARFSKKKVLSVPAWTTFQNWSLYRTPERSYKEGDLVWVEILGKNKEGRGGAEHYSLAWKKAGESAYALIPAQTESGKVVLSVPPVEPEDTRDIGVPQSWLGSVGLGMLPLGHPSLRLYADTDGDGFNLLEEYQTGGRPESVGGNRGVFSVEKWTGVSETSVEAFVKGERFLTPASESFQKAGALDLAESGNSYALRLRTCLVPPLSGEWTFYVAGDDSARLLLSANGHRFLKKTIASTAAWTNRYQWTKYSSQKSAPMSLEAGEPYFLEALQYQDGGGAHVSVAWQYKAPNLSRMEGVTATQSSTYGTSGPEAAIDGSLDTQAHTNWLTSHSWWQLTFPLAQSLNQVVIFNRTDATNGRRLSNFRLSVLDEAGQEIIGKDFFTEAGTYAGEKVVWELPETVQGLSIRIEGLGLNAQGNKYLCLREVEVYEQNEYSRAPVLVGGKEVTTIPAEPDDKDNNSLSDTWQEQMGLVEGRNGLTQKECGEYGDPDSDLVDNRTEYSSGTHPLLPSGVFGYLTQEMYANIAGWSVDDSMKSPAVLSKVANRTLLKNGQPGRNVGENYFRRLRGSIHPPVSGFYTFWISSDETSVLYLSENERKFKKKEIARVGYGSQDRGVYLTAFGQWDAFPKQRSKPVYLEAGKQYYLEASHKQYHAIDHLQIAWQIPGGVREVIPGEYLSSFGGDLADKDDDDLPDEWEKQYGIDWQDNGGKNFDNGAWGDPYRTGITNREAYLLGWDPRNPSLPNFGDTVVDIPVTGGVVNGGTWASAGNGILTPMGRGSITYTLNVPEKGRYLLEIGATPVGNVLEEELLSLSVACDGSSLGSHTLRSVRGAMGKVLFLLPELESGAHIVTLTLNNHDLRRSFALNSVRLLKPEGTSGENGDLPQWLQQYLGQQNVLTHCPASSLTSPVCIEGKARAIHLTRLQAGGLVRSLKQSAGLGWYANVTLPQDGSALDVCVSFESGVHQVDAHVKWDACDVQARESVTVRRGDSLRLTVGSPSSENGTFDSEAGSGVVPFEVTFSVEDKVMTTKSNIPLAMPFETVGVHPVRADWVSETGEPMSASMRVKVVDVQLGEAKDLITGLRRLVTLTGISQELLLQHEAPLRVDKSLTATPEGTIKLDVSSEKGGLQHLVARLGETGPIVDTLAFFSHDNTGSSTLSRIETVQEYGDGSSLVCMYLASSSLPEGGYIKISLTAGGVQFLEGGTELIVRAEDFGADGLYRVLMTIPRGTVTSICHVIRYYDKNDNQL